MHSPEASVGGAPTGDRLQRLRDAMRAMMEGRPSLQTIIKTSLDLVEGVSGAILARADGSWATLESMPSSELAGSPNPWARYAMESGSHLEASSDRRAAWLLEIPAADGSSILSTLCVRLDMDHSPIEAGDLTLLLVQREAGARFRSADIQLLEVLAWHAALALAVHLDAGAPQYEDASASLKAPAEAVRRFRAETRLEAARQELDSFSYSVSHDLRAPVRHINSYVALFKKHTAGTLDATASHQLDVIGGASQRLGTMLDDLLSLSRINRAVLAPVDVDLNALVRAVIEELQPKCSPRSVDWQVGSLPQVWGDRELVRSALYFLLDNARKFSRTRDTPRVEISFAELENRQNIIYVSDNGVGFDPNYAHNLFGVFRRLHHVSEFEGTGIGLACVKRIVERHGGWVGAEGKLNEGAKFYFSLPRPS
jgi:signal transduction histidine kinase